MILFIRTLFNLICIPITGLNYIKSSNEISFKELIRREKKKKMKREKNIDIWGFKIISYNIRNDDSDGIRKHDVPVEM